MVLLESNICQFSKNLLPPSSQTSPRELLSELSSQITNSTNPSSTALPKPTTAVTTHRTFSYSNGNITSTANGSVDNINNNNTSNTNTNGTGTNTSSSNGELSAMSMLSGPPTVINSQAANNRRRRRRPIGQQII